MDAATGALTDLTDEGIRGPLPILNGETSDITEFFIDVNPAWAPDSQSLAFSRTTWKDGEWRGNAIAQIPAAGGEIETLRQVTTDEPGIVSFGIHWQPDGSRIVYNLNHASLDEPDNGIWVMDADGGNARQITSIPVGDAAAGVADRGPLMVMQVAPGGERLLGYYWYAANVNATKGPFYAIVDAESGEITPVEIGDDAPVGSFISAATLSPDGSHLLGVTRLTTPDYQIIVRDLATGETTQLIDGLPRAFTIASGISPTWATNGAVFLNSDLSTGTLFRIEGGRPAPSVATPFAGPDATPLAEIGVTLIEQRPIEIPDTRVISLSPDGRVIAAAKPAVGYQRGQLCVYEVKTLAEHACADLSGLETGLRIEDVAWSPDGSYLVFSEQTFVYVSDGDLWLMDTATGELTNLDDDGFSGNLPVFGDKKNDTPVTLPVSPTFSPDGRSVAFSRSTILNGEFVGNDIAVVDIAGGEPRVLTKVTLDTPGIVYFGIRWAPDGTHLYYSVHFPDRNEPRNGIWVVDPDGLNQRQLLGTTDPDLGAPAVVQVSARGDRLLAFSPIAASQFDISGAALYAMVDTESGSAVPILVPGTEVSEFDRITLATLSPDGTTLLTVVRLADLTNLVWLTDLDTGASGQIGEPLTDAGPVVWGIIPTWAIDGTVLIPGGLALSQGTLLKLDGGLDIVPAATPEPAPVTPTAGSDRFAPGDRVITNDEAPLRVAPSAGATLALRVDPGTPLTILGPAREGDGFLWWPVEEPETRTIGYVRDEFLSDSEE